MERRLESESGPQDELGRQTALEGGLRGPLRVSGTCVRQKGTTAQRNSGPEGWDRAVLLGALCCLLETLVLLAEFFSDTPTVGARGSRPAEPPALSREEWLGPERKPSPDPADVVVPRAGNLRWRGWFGDAPS